MVAQADTPRSYLVQTDSGIYRRSRRHLQTTGATVSIPSGSARRETPQNPPNVVNPPTEVDQPAEVNLPRPGDTRSGAHLTKVWLITISLT